MLISDDDVREAVSSSRTMREAAQKLSIHYLTFRRRAKAIGVWLPRQGSNSGKHKKDNAVPLVEILEGRHYGYGGGLRKRLIDAGLKKNECEICGVSEWQGVNLTCELDHINGDSRDHRLENLRMLCPNCHSQTPTFRSKNIRSGRHHSISACGSG